MSKHAVATATPSGVSTVPAYLQGFAGMGNENVTRQELTVPRITVLQALSPQLDPSDSKYVETAKPGLLFNTVTGQTYKELKAVNTYFAKEFGLFRRRDQGGGFKGIFPSMEEAITAMEALPDRDAYEIIEQQVHYCLLLGPSGEFMGEAAIPMTSTKLKVSRAWNSLIQLSVKGGPRFSGVWTLSTVQEKNAKGSYYNFKVAPAGWLPKELLEPAKALYEAVSTGAKTMDRSDDESHPSEGVDY